MKQRLIVALMLMALLVAGCGAEPTPEASPTEPAADMANPASKFCVDQGYQSQIRDAAGGQVGYCIFPDGSECEEWAFFRGECAPASESQRTPAAGMANPASQFCVDQDYRSEIRSETGGQVGYCLFPDGSECEEWAFFRGECVPASEGEAPPGQIANPASENCVAVGGTWTIVNRVGGGQFGLCLFEDNSQCEEWALLRGDCPVGGVKVTGYVTPAAIYCAITGGEYAITGNSGADDEQGTCTFKDGSPCDAWEYYDGKCAPGSTSAASGGLIVQPLPEEVCNGQAQAMSHALSDLIPTQSGEPLDDPVTGARGIGCQAAISGTGVQFESPSAVVNALGSMLEEQGWTADPMFVADGPTGTAAGYRKGDQLCLAAAMWEPDESANCLEDQPISACEVTPEQQNYTVTLNCGVATAEGGTGAEAGSAELVFDSTRGGLYRDLYVMNRDGYDLSRLTRGEADSIAGPWSPDGTCIVYTTFGLTTSDIVVINADGSGLVNLTNTPDVDEGFPAWSPDGTHIAFTSRRDGNNEIYVMKADGTQAARWTDNPADDFAPAWSPDGTQIAFVSDRDWEAGIYDLYIMEVVSTAATRLTDDGAIDYSPAWSPDGTRIAFRSHHDGPADIYVINVDGTGLTNLTNSPADDWSPAWSPDGTLMAFQTNRDGNWEIYTMAVDGSGVMNLTNDPADDQMPFWRP